MKTYNPEELIKVPVECSCGKNMRLLAPMRARNDEMLLIVICDECKTQAAIQLKVIDKIPDHLVTAFIEGIHAEGYPHAKKEDIPSTVDES